MVLPALQPGARARPEGVDEEEAQARGRQVRVQARRRGRHAGGGGVELLKNDPHIVAALIIGTIIGVCFFKGVAVGPLIAGGMTYALMKLFASIK